MSKILIGVSGGIAAYKALDIVSYFKKQGHDVHVIMTKNALEFVTPLSFESLSNNKVHYDTFDKLHYHTTEHISLTENCDLYVIVPATANIIAKVVNGLADDMLSTTFLAANCPKLICPAMNTRMYNNPITQANLKKALDYNMEILDSESGILACGDIGKGRLAHVDKIKEKINYMLKDDDLRNKRVLITLGATCEAIDPVRFITNHSSGKMGIALAKAYRSHGADVTIIKANSNIESPLEIKEITAISASDMFEEVKENYQDFDIVIMCAAISDYYLKNIAKNKIKKDSETLKIELYKTIDILKYLGQHRLTNQKIIGFAMETENLIENARKKLINKNVDLIVANPLLKENAGFKSDNNQITIISKDKEEKIPTKSKEELAYDIIKAIKELK